MSADNEKYPVGDWKSLEQGPSFIRHESGGDAEAVQAGGTRQRGHRGPV